MVDLFNFNVTSEMIDKAKVLAKEELLRYIEAYDVDKTTLLKIIDDVTNNINLDNYSEVNNLINGAKVILDFEMEKIKNAPTKKDEEYQITVSELTKTIKESLELNPQLKSIKNLTGEISNYISHRSGHRYFAIKDDKAQIRAIMFSSHATRLDFIPKDGDKVVVSGSISVYEPQGTYSIQVSSMKLAGQGDLYQKYLELKKELNNRGWFTKPKKTIPKYPKRIGVVTSPTGAVIEDITNTVNRRYRLTEIILYPALVQGPSSSKSISMQINKANLDNFVDILIVGRGGGSIEDLWGFNELETITAIYNSKIPIITAIGHETDDTLSDLVSDLRAPTPTAAAEMATPSTFDLETTLKTYQKRMTQSFNHLVSNYQNLLLNHLNRLEVSSPTKKLSSHRESLNSLSRQLNANYLININALINNLSLYKTKIISYEPKKLLENLSKELVFNKVKLNDNYKYILERKNNDLNNLKNKTPELAHHQLTNKQKEFSHLISILEKVNPLAIMKRGFSLTKNENDEIIKSVKEVNVGDYITITYIDGSVQSKITKKGEENGKENIWRINERIRRSS